MANSLYSGQGISPPIEATARHLGAIAARHWSIAGPTDPVPAQPFACIRPTALRTELSGQIITEPQVGPVRGSSASKCPQCLQSLILPPTSTNPQSMASDT